jgi:hypothetical protein
MTGRQSYQGACRGCGRTGVLVSAKNGHRCSGCRVNQRRERVRQAAAILGNQCNRCGITYPLAWDHINNDPKRTATGGYRRVLHSEQAEFTRIIESGTSDRLQLLCHNCNWLKYHDPAEFDRPPTWRRI